MQNIRVIFFRISMLSFANFFDKRNMKGTIGKIKNIIPQKFQARQILYNDLFIHIILDKKIKLNTISIA